jgi:hypothetical protein
MVHKNRPVLVIILLLLLFLPLLGLDTKSSFQTYKLCQQQPIEKRKQVKQACVYCRKRHQKCDEKRPCNRCGLEGQTCEDGPNKRKYKKNSIVHQKEHQADPYASLGKPMDNDLQVQILEQTVCQTSNHLYNKFISWDPKQARERSVYKDSFYNEPPSFFLDWLGLPTWSWSLMNEENAVMPVEEEKICLYCLRHNCDSLDCLEQW